VRDQTDKWAHFAVIKYVDNDGKFVYSARRNGNRESSYICKLHQQGLLCSNNVLNSLV